MGTRQAPAGRCENLVGGRQSLRRRVRTKPSLLLARVFMTVMTPLARVFVTVLTPLPMLPTFSLTIEPRLSRMLDGEMHGEGVMEWPNGVRLEGEFEKGLFPQQASLITGDGPKRNVKVAEGFLLNVQGWPPSRAAG